MLLNIRGVFWMMRAIVGATIAHAAEPTRVPAAAFAQFPEYSNMALSPDGKYVAFLRDFEGRRSLFFADLDTMKLSRVEPGFDSTGHRRRAVHSFEWIGDNRVVFLTTIWDRSTGFSATDRDGKKWKALTGPDSNPNGIEILYASQTIHAFDDDRKHVLMLSLNGTLTLDRYHPDVVKVDSFTGRYERVVKNPGNVIGWSVDNAGVVRLGITAEGLNFGAIYRDGVNAPWRPLPAPERGRPVPLAFDGANEKLFVSAATPAGRHGIYRLDPVTGVYGEPLVADADYDIVSPDFGPEVDGVSLNTVVYSERKKAVVGIRSVAEGPRVRWLDREFATVQAALDRALPGNVNIVTSFSRDEQRMLVLSLSDRDPGIYYVFDAKTRGLRRLAVRMPDLKPTDMADVFPVKYTARDGLLIRGFLTFPKDRPQKDRPLIVMPHGGPWVRDVWGFDPLAQMLASRGYAVLQMNYRGSTGYGVEFSAKGRREVGRAIQDDIEDGARWAIAQGFADPRRVAIVGASYGGYSALFALGKNPDLYCCGISIAGVADWLSLIKGGDDPETRFAYLHWVQQIGDPAKDEAFLKSVSPVNFADKMMAPLLIIQGEADQTVPPKQARLMVAALEKSGRTPETLFLPESAHYFGDQKELVTVFERIESFLARHMPADDAPPTSGSGK